MCGACGIALSFVVTFDLCARSLVNNRREEGSDARSSLVLAFKTRAIVVPRAQCIVTRRIMIICEQQARFCLSSMAQEHWGKWEQIDLGLKNLGFNMGCALTFCSEHDVCAHGISRTNPLFIRHHNHRYTEGSHSATAAHHHHFVRFPFIVVRKDNTNCPCVLRSFRLHKEAALALMLTAGYYIHSNQDHFSGQLVVERDGFVLEHLKRFRDSKGRFYA